MATETLRPNAAGDYTNIASQYPASGAHWDKVDEASADDGSTYVYTAQTSQQKDAYNLQGTAIPSGSTINSVKVYFRINNEGNFDHTYAQPFLRLGANETTGTQVDHYGTTWTTYNEILSRPGGGGWGVSDLNSLQVAIGIYTSDFTRDAACTQVYVEVDYTPAGGGGKSSWERRRARPGNRVKPRAGFYPDLNLS